MVLTFIFSRLNFGQASSCVQALDFSLFLENFLRKLTLSLLDVNLHPFKM